MMIGPHSDNHELWVCFADKCIYTDIVIFSTEGTPADAMPLPPQSLAERFETPSGQRLKEGRRLPTPREVMREVVRILDEHIKCTSVFCNATCWRCSAMRKLQACLDGEIPPEKSAG
jgi:hypothetical protein